MFLAQKKKKKKKNTAMEYIKQRHICLSTIIMGGVTELGDIVTSMTKGKEL